MRAVGAMRADGSIAIPLYHTSVLVKDIAALLGTEYEGVGECEITAAAPLESAASTDLRFVASHKAAAAGRASAAGCLIVIPEYKAAEDQTVVRVARPGAAFASILVHLYPLSQAKTGIHASAIVDKTAEVSPDCSIGPYVTIGAHAVVGGGVVVGAGCAIGVRARIGANSLLHPRVTIYDDVSIG